MPVEILEADPKATITLATVIRGIRACQAWDTLKRVVMLEMNTHPETNGNDDRYGGMDRGSSEGSRAEEWKPQIGSWKAGERPENADRQSSMIGGARKETTHTGGMGGPEQNGQPPEEPTKTTSIREEVQQPPGKRQGQAGRKRVREPGLRRERADKKRNTGEQRRSGWATLSDQGFEEVELRETPEYGGGSSCGVFVREGYLLEKSFRIPYFGRTVPNEEEFHHNNVYLATLPGRTDYVLDGNPRELMRERPGLAPGTWAGAYVNHAKTPGEENCMMRTLTSRSGSGATDHYRAVTTEPVKVCYQLMKTVRPGQQLLAAYGWSEDKQLEHECGYAYFASHTSKGHELVAEVGEKKAEDSGELTDFTEPSCYDPQGRSSSSVIRARPVVGHLRPPRLRPERTSPSPDETGKGEGECRNDAKVYRQTAPGTSGGKDGKEGKEK